jgi:hypothetical protein
VASGVYTPAPADGDRNATFPLRSGLAIYGGFTPGQQSLAERDPNPATNATVLSGDLNGDDGANFLNNGENSYQVVTGSGTDSTAVLSGFTIRGGNANGPTNETRRGGGVVNITGSPTLTHLAIRGNSALNNGGGMLNNNSSPALVNLTITGNIAQGNGGGMLNNNSHPRLTNIVISGNSANTGAGMFNANTSNPVLSNITISGNAANSGGGGIGNNNSSPTLRNCILWNNAGGQISNASSTPIISHSIVQDSTAGGTVLNVDPLFVAPIILTAKPVPTSDGNFRLRPGSPAINAGDNHVADPAIPATDIDGAPRVVGGIVDLGAYELFAAPTFTNTTLTVVAGSPPIDLATAAGVSVTGGTFSGTGVDRATGTFDPTGITPGSVVSITYTLENAFGATNFATFTIEVTTAGIRLNPPVLTLTGAGPHLLFHGVPGMTYQIQFSDNLISWQDLPGGLLVADPTGYYEITDSTHPRPQARFYRSSTTP